MTEHATSAVKPSASQFGSRAEVHIRLNENVNLETLQNIVARIAGLSGCTTCGLLGVDLRLSGDPAETKQIGQLPGVQSVSFG